MTFVYVAEDNQSEESTEESDSDSELVKSKHKFNSYLEENNLFHQNLVDASIPDVSSHSLEHSLASFTKLDILDEKNKFICHTCSNGKLVNKYILLIAITQFLLLF